MDEVGVACGIWVLLLLHYPRAGSLSRELDTEHTGDSAVHCGTNFENDGLKKLGCKILIQ